MLATAINEKQAEIKTLSDQLQYLVSIKNRIIETCNRKLYEISSSRITHANILIAIVALIISIISLTSRSFFPYQQPLQNKHYHLFLKPEF